MSVTSHDAPLSVVASPDDEMVRELVDSLRPRLAATVADEDIPEAVRSALDELGPVRVTNYLGILVERRVRERLDQTPTHSPGQTDRPS